MRLLANVTVVYRYGPLPCPNFYSNNPLRIYCISKANLRAMDAAPRRVQAPYMLDNLTADAQRISASLPPDDWNSNSVLFVLRRDVGGVVVMVSITRGHFSLCVRLNQGFLKPSPSTPGNAEIAGDPRSGMLGWLRRLIRTAVDAFVGARRM
jgi:hypothetical protein